MKLPSEPDATGVIIVDHGSRRAESNDMLTVVAELFTRETPYSIVEPAHMELAQPTIQDAFDRCVARGATDVIVLPFFLAPGRHWTEDIPRLAAEAAVRHPGVSYVVTAPLGAHPLLVQVMLDRIQECFSTVETDA